MIYSSPEFVFLFLATFFAYLLTKNYASRFTVLIASSLFFYAWSGNVDTIIFFSVVYFSWFTVWLSVKMPLRRRLLIRSGIFVMLLHLFFWKYASWLIRELQAIYPSFLNEKKIQIHLPVGISFFTLQGIAYLVDFYQGKAEFIKFHQYALFKSFFGQLVAGPIVRANQLLPQINLLIKASYSDITEGVALFCLGFFKKIFIADRCAPFVDAIFADANPDHLPRQAVFLALLGYTVQIWGDFSGYTDMGRGASLMLGIRLPENFSAPYFAKSPSEFWKRWHITLSQWIRDYIYIPLGGASGGKTRAFVVLIITMGISGLWHGANWTFVCWGLYHALLLIFERLITRTSIGLFCENFFARTLSEKKIQVMSIIFMFFFTVLGWLIFRVQSLTQFFLFIKGIIFSDATSCVPVWSTSVCISILCCVAIQILEYKNLDMNNTNPSLFKKIISYVWKNQIENKQQSVAIFYGVFLGFLLSLLFVFTIIFRYHAQEKGFIYFQF